MRLTLREEVEPDAGDYPRVVRRTLVEFIGSQLVVSSPGGFPPGITVDNIISERLHPRNAALTHVFRSLRLAEQEAHVPRPRPSLRRRPAAPWAVAPSGLSRRLNDGSSRPATAAARRPCVDALTTDLRTERCADD